jgi:hypothetical protein
VCDARIVPRHAVLVRLRRVVLLGHEVTEQTVGERFVAVRLRARDVERDRVVLADVLREGLAGLAVEHDDAHHPLQAEEEVVLAALVVVQRADHARAREREVRLADRLRQPARAHQLHEPAALVLMSTEGDPRDH